MFAGLLFFHNPTAESIISHELHNVYLIYGNFLDRYPGMAGYRIVFCVMIGWAVVGIFVSTFLISRIKKHHKEG